MNTQRDHNEDDTEREQSTKGFQLQKSIKKFTSVGRLHVKLAQVINTDLCEDVSLACMSSADDDEDKKSISTYNGKNKHASISPKIIASGAAGSGPPTPPPRTISFRDVEDPYAVDIAAIPVSVATPEFCFQDYVNDGLQLDFCVAIDFTSSNGRFLLLDSVRQLTGFLLLQTGSTTL